MNVLLLYRSNGIDKYASVGTHNEPKGKESGIGNAIWLVGNHMHLSTIKKYLYS